MSAQINHAISLLEQGLGQLYDTELEYLNRAISLLEQGLGQLYETELEYLAIGMGASDDIRDGQGEEHQQELIDMIKEMLLSAGKGKPAAKKPAAKKPAEDEEKEEEEKEKEKEKEKECGVKSTGSKAKLVEWIMEAPWNKFKEEKLEEALAEVRESWDALDEEEQGEYA